MGVTVKVKINNVQKIIRDHGLNDDGSVTKFLRNEVGRFCDPYIPMKKGTLKNTKTYPNGHTIKYTSKYAHYMYKGKLMVAPNGSSWAKFGENKHYNGKSLKFQGAPKRGAEWDKRMMNDRASDIIRNVNN